MQRPSKLLPSTKSQFTQSRGKFVAPRAEFGAFCLPFDSLASLGTMFGYSEIV